MYKVRKPNISVIYEYDLYLTYSGEIQYADETPLI
jgi:hypothetical protein